MVLRMQDFRIRGRPKNDTKCNFIFIFNFYNLVHRKNIMIEIFIFDGPT